MTYHVYENWTINKAIVHEGRCPYCKHGRGIHRTDRGRNGQWHGPYETRDEALQHARATERRDVRACKFCLGGQ